MRQSLLLASALALIASAAFATPDPNYGSTPTITVPFPGRTLTTNGFIGSANVYQTALAANDGRKGCRITNKSQATLLVYVGPAGSGNAAQSYIIPAGTATSDGGYFDCGLIQGLVLSDEISITSATATSAYMVSSQ